MGSEPLVHLGPKVGEVDCPALGRGVGAIEMCQVAKRDLRAGEGGLVLGAASGQGGPGIGESAGTIPVGGHGLVRFTGEDRPHLQRAGQHRCACAEDHIVQMGRQRQQGAATWAGQPLLGVEESGGSGIRRGHADMLTAFPEKATPRATA